MKKKTAIRLFSFMAAAIFALGGVVIKQMSKSKKYELKIENEYSKSLSELTSRVDNIGFLLDKIIYVTGSPKLSTLSAELYSEAELAKNAVMSLPVSYENGGYDTVNRFLSQVGNYALSVSKNVITGEQITDKQEQNLILLDKTAKAISQSLGDSQSSYNNLEHWAKIIEDKFEENSEEGSLADALYELEENLTDYPTLIYDGPYSDHILTKEPLMTSAAPVVDKNKAKQTAVAFSLDNALEFKANQGGKIECYRFSSNTTEIAVTKNGGYVLYMRKISNNRENKISYDTAVSKAKRFLNDRGYSNMTPTYYYTDEGVCTINFAYLDGQTLCYTDLIKVGIDASNGDVVMFESGGYLSNHTPRAFETPLYTSEEATSVLNEKLTTVSTAIALIPTSGAGEVRCYEFTCKTESGTDIIIYVNTQTLITEEIFVLVKTDGGTLVK